MQLPGSPLPTKPGLHSHVALAKGGGLSVQVALPLQGGGVTAQASMAAPEQQHNSKQHCDNKQKVSAVNGLGCPLVRLSFLRKGASVAHPGMVREQADHRGQATVAD